MIGSVTASKRAAAFAQALDEHELDEAAAADRTAAEGGGREATSAASVPAASVPEAVVAAPVCPCPAGGGAPAPLAAGAATAAVAPGVGEVTDAGGDPLRDPLRGTDLRPDRDPAALSSGDDRAPSEDPARTVDEGGEPALLLGLAEKLRNVPRPTVSPDVKTVQRAQLVAAMEAEFASPEARVRQVPAQRDNRGARKGAHRAPAAGPLTRLRPNSRWGKGIAAGGLGVGVAASALGGVAAASSEALPGDSLYGVKRGMEDLRLDFADDATDRGQVHLDRASTRLREARRLMERSRGGAPLDEESVSELRRALSGMRYDADEGHRLLSSAYERDGSIGPMRTLSSFSSGQRQSWLKLREDLPPELSDVRDEVSFAFDAMDSDIAPIAGLISTPDERTAREHGGGSERRGPGHASPRTPSSSGSADADGKEHESDEPEPSGPLPGADELTGDGGLLDPSKGPRGGSGADAGGSGRSHHEPDVTLPPIVPHVLPELHGLGEDDK
ncbi:hypothetical protein K378_05535 [Streptomyces sp. Amel2xB2]|uniref:DUF5667 domain-containing protein n=1 Tax=Streptomyces sp. Amel2xB2 TaxID=1305829 RepID=UPI000DB9DE39|nr:DUF5667 domain-containing protein [Streptomyces sp. Amel2xB2]RAJ57377.1 hypothetical protein K378_05535 [Streptomyces sp. Amel2xB2]